MTLTLFCLSIPSMNSLPLPRLQPTPTSSRFFCDPARLSKNSPETTQKRPGSRLGRYKEHNPPSFRYYHLFWCTYLSGDMPEPLADPTDSPETINSFKSLIYLKPHTPASSRFLVTQHSHVASFFAEKYSAALVDSGQAGKPKTICRTGVYELFSPSCAVCQ
jgi:hypothetical protein